MSGAFGCCCDTRQAAVRDARKVPRSAVYIKLVGVTEFLP
jgi:hypothetical protein